MKISKQQMERRAVVNAMKHVLLDAIEKSIGPGDITYAEMIHALQEVQSRFIESAVVNEWDGPVEPS